jgi:type I restriction enzyme S subunit
MSFPKYPKYKDSGVEWLGEVPEHWHHVRVKNIFAIGRGRVISLDDANENGTYPVFSSQTTNNGCLGFIETFDFDCEQITWTTDGANAGTVFLRKGKHNCTNVCGTLQVKSAADYSLNFGLHYLSFATQFYKRPDTNGAKIMNGEMAEIAILVPPLQEQTTIATFLDAETAKIDTLVSEQKRLIELLKEKRQAVISQAVTKGLNPDVPMMVSGVECLGVVRAGWEVVSLKRFCDVRDGTHDTPQFIDSSDVSFPFVTSKDLVNGHVCLDETKHVSATDYHEISRRSGVARGDVLMPMIGSIGGAVLVETDVHFVIKNIALFKASTNYNSRWLKLMLDSDLSVLQFELNRSGGVQGFVALGTLRNLSFPFPSLYEQDKIVEFIDIESAKFDTLTTEAHRAIALLQERRTALISAAVTGQIDVRNYVNKAVL